MIVTCHNCTTRLQLDEAKIPVRPFSVRCPKCQQIINAQPPSGAARKDAMAAVGDLPTSTRTQQEMSVAPAVPVLGDAQAAEAPAVAPAEGELSRLLAMLLRQGAGEPAGVKGATQRPPWERRRALVCVGHGNSETVARTLAESRYEVLVARNTQEAAEFMREEKLDVIVLDQDFDRDGQGATYVNREINSLRMPERRRVVLVQLSHTARTGDLLAAFLDNANLIVNSSDLDELPRVLEKNIRDLNELYRDFNKALSLPGI